MQKQVGSGIRFADWAVVILAGILFFKTAEVLAYFAPQSLNALIGMDISWLYGLVTAFFIEGVALAYHFYPGARVYTPAIVVKWTLIAISGICQVFDARIVTNTLTNMTEAQQLFFLYGVPLLPWFVLILIFFVGAIPNEAERKPFRGIRGYLPDMKRLWNGEQNSVFSSKKVVQANIEEDELPKSPNGQEKEAVNPTIRQP